MKAAAFDGGRGYIIPVPLYAAVHRTEHRTNIHGGTQKRPWESHEKKSHAAWNKTIRQNDYVVFTALSLNSQQRDTRKFRKAVQVWLPVARVRQMCVATRHIYKQRPLKLVVRSNLYDSTAAAAAYQHPFTNFNTHIRSVRSLGLDSMKSFPAEPTRERKQKEWPTTTRLRLPPPTLLGRVPRYRRGAWAARGDGHARRLNRAGLFLVRDSRVLSPRAARICAQRACNFPRIKSHIMYLLLGQAQALPHPPSTHLPGSTYRRYRRIVMAMRPGCGWDLIRLHAALYAMRHASVRNNKDVRREVDFDWLYLETVGVIRCRCDAAAHVVLPPAPSTKTRKHEHVSAIRANHADCSADRCPLGSGLRSKIQSTTMRP